MPTDASKLRAAEQKLVVINHRIDSHVLNSPLMKEARRVASERPDEGREAVSRALSERGLPSLASQGRALLLGLTSLARLNRKRIKLEHRIAHLQARDVH